MNDRGGFATVEQLHPYQNVCDRSLQSYELDALPSESTGHLDRTPFDEGVGEFLNSRGPYVFCISGQLQHDWQTHSCVYRRAPQNVVVTWRSFLDFKIGRARLVRRHTPGKADARKNREQKKNSDGLEPGTHGAS